MKELERFIRDIPDFPKPGIIFKDISPLLADKDALKNAADALAAPFADQNIDLVAGIEARGFLFGTMIAERLGAGFVPIRKPGKLPARTHRETYELEYGADAVEVHADAVKSGQRILMFDDLIATGGSMAAACRLIEQLRGNIVGISVLVELSFLGGREVLEQYPLHSLIKVSGE